MKNITFVYTATIKACLFDNFVNNNLREFFFKLPT